MLTEYEPVLIRKRPDRPNQVTSIEALTEGTVVILHDIWPPVEREVENGKKVIISEEHKREVIILGPYREEAMLVVLDINGEFTNEIYLSTYAIIPEEGGLWNNRYWIESTGRLVTPEIFRPNLGPDQIRNPKNLKRGENIWICTSVQDNDKSAIVRKEAVILKEPFADMGNQKIEVEIVDRNVWEKRKEDLFLASYSVVPGFRWSWSKDSWIEPRDNEELTPVQVSQQFREAFNIVFKLLGHDEGDRFADDLIKWSSEIKIINDNFLLKIQNKENSQLATFFYFYPWERRISILLNAQAEKQTSEPIAEYFIDILEIEEISKNSNGSLSLKFKEENVLTLEKGGSVTFRSNAYRGLPSLRQFNFKKEF